MSERIFIGVAWPYANGSVHIGQVAGAYLPADIFARYHRLKGNEVVMVSGSDKHGTPTAIKAEQEHKSPEDIAAKYQEEFTAGWKKLGITYDLYTTTGTANHAAVAQDIFLKLLEKEYLYKASVSQAYCSSCRRFLPDRYIEGTCPNCKSPNARGDQCEACGKPLDAPDLIGARCRLCGTSPEYRDSDQYFFRLPLFRDRLLEWIEKKDFWRSNVLNFTRAFLKEGLIDRAITRDIDWGVPVPVEGFENKRIYVWFEAVIGYLSATKEWAKNQGDPEKWRDFWLDKKTKSYYFIGKDNIVFHTILWPAMLMGYGDEYILPYDVPANEFLTIEGKKVSTSRNWAVWIPDYLERYDPDPLRYMLSISMPETSDTDFSWTGFVRRNNDELVAAYGNLVNRVLTFTYKNFDGHVPDYTDMGADNRVLPLDEKDKEILASSQAVMENVLGDGKLLALCHFKQAITEAMGLAREANRYLDEKEPWKVIKENRKRAALSLYVTIGVIYRLKMMLYPFLPFSSQKVHEYLGYNGKVEDSGIKSELPLPGQKLLKPGPLFIKLDPKVAEEESAKLGKSS